MWRVAVIVVAFVSLAACSASSPSPRTGVRSPLPSPKLAPTPVPGIIPGNVLVADRENSRVIVVTPDEQVVWEWPLPGDLRPGESFRGPDDAFLTPDGRHVMTNEEFAGTLVEIDVATRKISWSFGLPGDGAGRKLSNPDDAYVLPSGEILVSDIKHCRILIIRRDHTIARQIGGSCRHDPPRGLSSPNGGTPLSDGGLLISEIGGAWVDRLDRNDHLLWSIHVPGVRYPSDPQPTPDGNYIVADFSRPGGVVKFTSTGKVLLRYAPSSGEGRLDRTSLAQQMSNGFVILNDDYNHRVVVIDPRTNRIVWQYGRTGIRGRGPGYLAKPDGLDIVPAVWPQPSG